MPIFYFERRGISHSDMEGIPVKKAVFLTRLFTKANDMERIPAGNLYPAKAAEGHKTIKLYFNRSHFKGFSLI